MNKSTILLFMAATGMLGCKNLAPVELVEPQPPPSSIPKPTDHPETIAWRSKKTSWSEPPRPAEQSSTPGSKTDADKRRPAGAASKTKPAGTPKKDPGEKTIAATPPANVSLSGIPRDVWYAILTIFGAVFTSILGPIAVEIIRERMIISRQQAKQQNGEAGECVAKQVP
ncbi:MAG TPA: hypothetical protein VKE98_02850 [Gemmataceae bacterium]|nr:hypothetical protein [Gemmataceae bacterium]